MKAQSTPLCRYIPSLFLRPNCPCLVNRCLWLARCTAADRPRKLCSEITSVEYDHRGNFGSEMEPRFEPTRPDGHRLTAGPGGLLVHKIFATGFKNFCCRLPTELRELPWFWPSDFRCCVLIVTATCNGLKTRSALTHTYTPVTSVVAERIACPSP